MPLLAQFMREERWWVTFHRCMLPTSLLALSTSWYSLHQQGRYERSLVRTCGADKGKRGQGKLGRASAPQPSHIHPTRDGRPVSVNRIQRWFGSDPDSPAFADRNPRDIGDVAPALFPVGLVRCCSDSNSKRANYFATKGGLLENILGSLTYEAFLLWLVPHLASNCGLQIEQQNHR